MSELDLGLKVGARRVLWKMGYTTRLDVALRSVNVADSAKGRRGTAQAFTDLDVLGLATGHGSRVESAIVDCKTSARGSTERMFWVRGVAEFFEADSAYMLREHELNGAARQLAARLGITALSSRDLGVLEGLQTSPADVDVDPVSWLFDRERVTQSLSAFGQLDKKLRSLTEYRQFDYWVYEEPRNPVQLVEHLRQSAKHLDPSHPTHIALVFDLAWMYLLSVAHAVAHVRRTNVSDPDGSLQDYLLGGPIGAREKRMLAELLDGLKSSGALPRSVDVDPLPSYYPSLLELVVRVLRRPTAVQTALRLLEVASAAALGGYRVPLGETMTDTFDEVAAKQAADVVGFLVGSAGVDRQFRGLARLLLLGEPIEATVKRRPAPEQPKLIDPPD